MSQNMTTQLLFELGTEELPAGPLSDMAIALHDGIVQGLAGRGLTHGASRWFATPRRLAVLVDDLAVEAPDLEQEVLGPPAAAAKDEAGNWTGAALGFARKQGVEADDLVIVESDKGPRLALKRLEKGARAADVAADIIAAAVAGIPVAKRMRWSRSRNEFLRPVQWLVAMLDDQVVPMRLFDLQSGRTSRGHRFHHPDNLELASAGSYQGALLDAKVVADFAERQNMIRRQVSAIAEADGAIAVIGDDLLHEVTGLVEWPVALQGSFDPNFLQVPAEALISSMKEHQKYFHLVDHDGQLLPKFITVSNIESRNPQTVISGNEKVIRPRLSDAAFFFNTDKKTPLAARFERLDSVVFQQKLGTLADKTKRIAALAGWLAGALGADSEVAERAATLAKCDLVSDMVLEFPELQGIAGAHYALHDGEPDAVVTAIEQHYWPKFAGDTLPTTREAAAVALADRLDTLAGIFGIGQTPTGSKDPFGLRRAAVAVIRILVDLKADLDLRVLAERAAAGFAEGVLEASAANAVTEYIIERLRAWYEDQDISIDVLRAVTATGITDPAEIDRRVHAVNVFAASDAASALAAANKRVANILAKTEGDVEGAPSAEWFVEAEEQALFAALTQIETDLAPLMAQKQYPKALESLASLREPVDAFFDKVMVNAEDPALRENRLRLLALLRQQFVGIADIAQLTGSA